MPSAARERELNDRLWGRVAPLLPPRPPHPKGGRPFADDRACFEGIVYVLRNGLRWRAMPPCYPSGVTCWRQHRDWTAAGVWDDVWKLILGELTTAGRLKADELVIDGTFAEAKGGVGVGPRRLGHGTTVEVVTDRRGVPLGAATDGANVHEVNLASAALADVPADLPIPWLVPVLADRAYDSDPLRESLADEGFALVARHRSNRTKPATTDGRVLRRLKRRWVVERSFAWLKGFRRVATRHERRCDLFDGFVSLACALVALNKLL